MSTLDDHEAQARALLGGARVDAIVAALAAAEARGEERAYSRILGWAEGRRSQLKVECRTSTATSVDDPAAAAAATPGLVRNAHATPEGKYPLVIRRDGQPLVTPYFVLRLDDPGAPAALLTYSAKMFELGIDGYAKDIVGLAEQAREFVERRTRPFDPTAPAPRPDDPLTILWARSVREDWERHQRTIDLFRDAGPDLSRAVEAPPGEATP
jgi:hypothetical protein